MSNSKEVSIVEGKRVLHLTLKKKWFDMIASGEKKEEYRELKMYWAARLCDGFTITDLSLNISDLQGAYKTSNGERVIDAVRKEFDVVCFKNGYSKDAPTLITEWKGIVIGIGKPEWGGGNDETFVIKLGEILYNSNNTPQSKL